MRHMFLDTNPTKIAKAGYLDVNSGNTWHDPSMLSVSLHGECLPVVPIPDVFERANSKTKTAPICDCLSSTGLPESSAEYTPSTNVSAL